MSSLSLNTNILSLNSQRQVSKHTANLRSNFVRLSSGLRINSASDDAAGLSIATKLDTDARVSSQGLRNLNDGISLINILEGATNELSNILIRVKELAEQSANGVYSNKQRQELSKEAEALKLEYQRILNSTSFNNIDLFGSSSASLSLQAGYGIESSLNIGLGRAGAYIEEVNKGVPGTFGTPYDISADGRYILISSSDNQIYRKDTISGEVLLASSSSAGVAGNSSNTNGYISADGRYVLFEAFSSNLIVGDSNAGYDIFRKDLLTNETILVSKNKEGVQGSGVHRSMGFSADGRYATFTSSATNLIDGDTNGVTDVFRKDLVTGEVLRVNTSSDGVQQGVGITGGGAISDDGQYVLFFSAATNLVDSDTNGGNYDIFRKNFQTGKTDIVSTTFGGNQITPVETPLRSLAISGDGRYAFFESSSASVTAGDTNGVVDIFRKGFLSGEVIRVSEGANGLQANGSSTNSYVSSDGRYVLSQSNP